MCADGGFSFGMAQRITTRMAPLGRCRKVSVRDDEGAGLMSLENGGELEESWAGVDALPPLPPPERCEQCAESTCGTVLVCALIMVFVGLTQAAALGVMEKTKTWVFLGLIYAEAVIAIISLLGILCGDPGTIKRSPETCFPMPEQVAKAIKAGQSLDGFRNISEGGRSYCVRCLVWRPDPMNRGSGSDDSDTEFEEGETHHCSTCQRCVVDFDHHCGVFGRCIAGRGFAGTMGCEPLPAQHRRVARTRAPPHTRACTVAFTASPS